MKVYYNYQNIGKIFGDEKSKVKKAHDATMKFLRDRAVSEQEKQALRSKRISGIAYLGLNQVGDLRFVCKSEDGSDTYIQSIRFYDMHKYKPRSKDEILRMLRESDVGVYCNDPSFLYYGAAYNATQGKYNIVIERRPPTRQLEIKKKFTLCKHLIAVLRAVPFYWNNMVSDYVKYFKLESSELNPAKSTIEPTIVEETNKPIPKLKTAQPAKPAEAQTTKREE